MYSIYIQAPREDPNTLLIYDDLNINEGYLLLDPNLVKEDNSAGSLEFEVPLENVGYPYITPYMKNMDVYVYKMGYKNIYGNYGTDDLYWSGRVIDVSRGIDNHKVVYCEGVLGFLNDTIQTPGVYVTDSSDNNISFTNPEKKSLRNYITYLLNRHNSEVEENRKIYPGEITAVYEPTTWYTNFESTMSVLENISSATNGHLRVRRTTREGHSVWALDLLNDDIWIPGEIDSNGIVMTEENKWRYRWIPNPDQQIEYGVNLTDLDQSFSLTNIITAVYPLGKRKETSSVQGLDEYYTIDGADTSKIPSSISQYISIRTDSNNYKYIRSSYADKVGKISTTVQYDDVVDPTELMLLGILSLTLENAISYEVEADIVDSSYRDRTLKPIDIYDIIEVVAIPHGLNSLMKVSKIEIPLDNPSSGTITIGTVKTGTFTELTRKTTSALSSEIKYLTVKPFEDPNASTIVDDVEKLESRVSKLESLQR